MFRKLLDVSLNTKLPFLQNLESHGSFFYLDTYHMIKYDPGTIPE